MENRKRAQSPLVGFLGVWVITSPHETGEGSAITSIVQPAEVRREHPLRAGMRPAGKLARRACGGRDRREKAQEPAPAVAVIAVVAADVERIQQ